MTMKEWVERWPQYEHTVPEEVLYEPVERRVNRLLTIASDAASRCGVSYEQTLEVIQRGMSMGDIPEVKYDHREEVLAELERLRRQRRRAKNAAADVKLRRLGGIQG